MSPPAKTFAAVRMREHPEAQAAGTSAGQSHTRGFKDSSHEKTAAGEAALPPERPRDTKLIMLLSPQ